MKLRFLPLLSLALALILAGCHSSGEIIASGLRIDLTKITRAADGTVHVSWRLRNPNVVTYLVDHTQHKVTLNGTVIGTVATKERVGVPREGEIEQSGVLTPANAGVAAQLAQLAGSGASYRLESTLWLLIVDDDLEKAAMTTTGQVPVVAE